MHTPPIVGEHIKYAQHEDQKGSGPFGFEANSNHNASTKSKDGNEYATDTPFTLKDKAKEQEDKENAASQKEVFFTICFADRGEASEQLLSGDHRIAEDHEQATNNAQITEEEVEIEDETITEALDNDHRKQTSNSVLCVFLENDRARSTEHGNHVEYQK